MRLIGFKGAKGFSCGSGIGDQSMQGCCDMLSLGASAFRFLRLEQTAERTEQILNRGRGWAGVLDEADGRRER